MRITEDGYALSRGETAYLHEQTADGEPHEDSFFIEVDRDTGIAYTRGIGLALLCSELSPWSGMPRTWGTKRER